MANSSTCSGPLNGMERWVAWQCFFPSIPYSSCSCKSLQGSSLQEQLIYTELKLGRYLDSPKSCGCQLCHGSSTVSQSSEMMYVPLLNRGGKAETNETRRYCRSQRMRESTSRA